MDLQAGTLVDHRYVVEKRIGEGGMAEVYRVRHVHLETQHALKVLTVGGKSLQRRLMQEGRVQAAMQHPNIVAVTDVVMVGGSPGLVMEYVTGPPMDDFLPRVEPTLAEIDALVVGVLDGVAAAHRLDLIHRDLKPANVMLAIVGDALVPKVADFGLVKLVAEDDAGFASKTRSGTAMGTPAYMPPEQVRDAKTVDHRADIWSLGAILWEIVTGERCFDAPDILELMVKVAGNERPHIKELRPDLPDRMANAIEAAMTTDREDRVGSVMDLKRMWLEGAPALPMEPWTQGTLEIARSLGSGGEDASEFLKRSFRSTDQLGMRKGGTAVPLSGTPEPIRSRTAVPVTKSDATFAMDYDEVDSVTPTAVPAEYGDEGELNAPAGAAGGNITIGPEMFSEAAQRGVTIGPEVGLPEGTLKPSDHDGSLSPVEHVAVTPDVEPAPRSKTALLVAAAGVLLLGGGAAAAVATGGLAVFFGGGAEPIEQPEGIGDTPEDAPDPQPDGAPEPAPAPQPAPTTAPQPTPAPGAVPVPVPAAAPAPSGEADAPQPAPATAPAPTGAPQPAPEPEGTAEPAPAPAPAATASITLDSDVTVIFRDSAGNKVDPASVPPGTYSIIAFFQEGVPTEQGTVTVTEGSTPTVKCIGARQICRAL